MQSLHKQNQKISEENVKALFVEFLVEHDIKNDNGLKTLEQLEKEYPMEWKNFKS